MKRMSWTMVLVVLLGLLVSLPVYAGVVIEDPGVELESFAIESFGEAPLLAERVAQGELPTVEERLPLQPYVVVADDIGLYGGTANLVTLRPRVTHIDGRIMDFTGILQPQADGGGSAVSFARKVEISEDASTFTVHLREGVKWSDGAPFSAHDIMFWYHDYLLNEDLFPVVGSNWRTEGEVVEVTMLDEYTVEFAFVGPNPFFEMRLAHTLGSEPFLPRHYLEQFHINYVDENELIAMAEAAGFENWYQFFFDRADRTADLPNQPDLPTLAPYRLLRKDAERHIFERNPYFWKVDAEGNQLPYIDRIEVTLASDRGMIDGMIVSGQLDYEGSATDIRSYPLYRNFEEEGGYRALLWTSGMANEVIYQFNLTHNDPVMREIFQDVRFRRAMSLAIDRQEINEVIYFGHAEPMQYTALESSRYYKPEFAQAYAEFDPEAAAALLDEMGLDQRDGEGYRLRPDGERLIITLEFFDFETPKLPNIELVVAHWQAVGVDVRTRAVSGELQSQRAEGNLMDATIWHGDTGADTLFPFGNRFVVPETPDWNNTIWPEWARWNSTNGEEGEEPPAEVMALIDWYDQMLVEPSPERRVELGQNLLASQAENLWVIGTVGKAPWVLIVSENLRNVPEQGLWVWDNLWSRSMNPSSFYFAQ